MPMRCWPSPGFPRGPLSFEDLNPRNRTVGEPLSTPPLQQLQDEIAEGADGNQETSAPATRSSSSLEHHRTDARIVENGSAASSDVSNSAKVGLANITKCCGPSSLSRPSSVSGDPIVKLPAGMTSSQGNAWHTRESSRPIEVPAQPECRPSALVRGNRERGMCLVGLGKVAVEAMPLGRA